MNKEKALKNQGLEFREDILLKRGGMFCEKTNVEEGICDGIGDYVDWFATV